MLGSISPVGNTENFRVLETDKTTRVANYVLRLCESIFVAGISFSSDVFRDY